MFRTFSGRSVAVSIAEILMDELFVANIAEGGVNLSIFENMVRFSCKSSGSQLKAKMAAFAD